MAGIVRVTETRSRTWEFALVVLDTWQRRGVGRRLMIALMDALQERKGESIEGDVLALNRNMLDFVARLDFAICAHPDQPHLKRVKRKLPQREGGTNNASAQSPEP